MPQNDLADTDPDLDSGQSQRLLRQREPVSINIRPVARPLLEPDSKRSRRSAGDMDLSAFENMLQTMNENNQTSMKSMIREEIGSLTKEVGCVTKQMMSMTTRMGTLEIKVTEDFGKFDSRLTELEGKVNAQSRCGSTNGSDAGDRGGTGGHQQTKRKIIRESRQFVPRNIEIKGFVRNFDTREGAASNDQVKEFLAKLFAHLRENHTALMQLVDEDNTLHFAPRPLHTKICIRLAKGTDRSDAFDVRKPINAFCKGLDEALIHGSRPYAVVEASPQQKEIYSIGMKAINSLNKAGVEN